MTTIRKFPPLLLLVLLGWAFPAGILSASDALSFNRDIRPILSDNCFQCHGPDQRQRKANLRLDQRQDALHDRKGVRVVIPGNPAQSELVKRINHPDPEDRMPPRESGRTLSPNERRLLESWIDQGAPYQAHWAFITPRRPTLPQVKDSSWTRNPIDTFVLARLEREGLKPSPPANRQRLIRRLSFDLTGLPPSIAELNTFDADPSPTAVESLIDELLSRETFGEHMAVGWLDAARYADTNGYNNDTPRYNWRWRDWIIGAFNRNLPFDQFLIEQLAGDLIPAASTDQQLATGFNRNHNVTSEGGIIDEEYRLEYVADRVHTTATVFLALSLQCARCHDHKFDPISQRDYYAFSAFFNQVPETGYHKEHVGNPKPVMTAPTAEQSTTLRGLTDTLTQIESRLLEHQENTALPKRAELEAHLTAQRKTVEQFQAGLPTAMVMRDQESPRDTFILMRGDYDKPGDKVTPGIPEVFPAFPEDTPRDRLGLARWMTDPKHPLTARVVVNRLWHGMFGNGIVETLEDFGSQGAWPTHPELLDWLAVQLIESGWDTKAMLKLIASSATYGQSPRITPELLQRDPNNRLLARGPRNRLSGEMIRDHALTISGLLRPRIGGSSVKPYQPPGLWTEVIVADDSYSGGAYRQDTGDNLYRRGVYTWWKRTCPPPALNIFDAPDREFCTVRRRTTNTPLQTLVLLNDPTFVEASRALAQRILIEGGATTESRALFAFRLGTSRRAQPEELAVLSEAYHRQRTHFTADPASAARLIQVGESVPDPSLNPVDLAAWTTVASLILNLDESITR